MRAAREAGTRVQLAAESAKRDLIRAHVLVRPGASIAEAAAAAEVTHPTASYHLSALLRDSVVESERHLNKRLWFEARRFDEWERRAVAVLRSPETTAVLTAVWASPWTYLAEVAAAHRISRLTVAAAARRLGALGLVGATREGRVRTLVPVRRVLEQRGAPLAAKLADDDPARRVLDDLLGAP